MSDLVAIYAAGLSTVLAIAKFAERPLISLERADPPDDSGGVVHLRVINPAKRALFIEGYRQFPRSAPPLRIVDQTPLNRRADIVAAFEQQHLSYPRMVPRLCVPAGGTGLLRVSGIKDGDARQMIVFWWHRSWLLPLRLPVWIRVSGDLVLMVNRAGG